MGIRNTRLHALPLLVALGAAILPCALRADEARDFVPEFLGAQYTFIDQRQDPLRSPYSGSLSIKANGDTARSHTFGAYFGLALPAHFQFYFDVEMFKGEGVSNAAGLGGLTNGDVVRSGTTNLGKRPYAARHYLRYVLPLGGETTEVARAQDQLPGAESTRRIEAKLGKMAANDDFDKNRYANSTRTQFMNWSLWNNTAWDFAAETRGYTNGLMLAWVDRGWALRYGIYQMPSEANGQTLEWPLTRARGEQIELTVQPAPDRWALRLMAYRNTARMGVYRDALALASENGQLPNIRADDRDGRRKTGYAANFELPLADDGETGLFARAGWNDGRTESFAFTEVDRTFTIGMQISGTRWRRADDHLAVGFGVNGLSSDHRDYLAAGGSGFLLDDGRLDYGRERIIEACYRIQVLPHVQITPDLQLIHNPGYNRDRGPARFVGLRAHLEF